MLYSLLVAKDDRALAIVVASIVGVVGVCCVPLVRFPHDRFQHR